MDEYWEAVRARAKELQSDGCSHVTSMYLDCCLEHDIHYRTGRTLSNEEISRAQADKIFRECMQSRSIFKVFSPMSWWRWMAVRLFGSDSYASKRRN